MEARYTNQKNTAPVVSALKNKDLPVKKSFFDLSCNISLDAPIGVIIPFDVIETLPDSDYEISYDILALTKNPLVRRMLSGCTVYIHTYGEKTSDMYEGFPTFVTRGRSGKITRSIPICVNDFEASDDVDPKHFYSHRFSPSAYLGLTPRTTLVEDVSDDKILGYYDKSITGKEFAPKVGFNALPLVMYQQICIHNYLPSNLLQDNKHLFPEDEQHLKLSATVQGTVYSLSYDDDIATAVPTNEQMEDVYYADSDTPVILDRLVCRQFDGDSFNTGLPFPELVRGDIPSVNLLDNLPSLEVGVTKDGDFWQVATPETSFYENGKYIFKGSAPDDTVFSADNYAEHMHTVLQTQATADKGVVSGKLYTKPTPIDTSVTMSQLRALDVLTQFRMRMALSDGSYNELIKAQWNKSPKLHVGKPFYIGGTKQPIIFNEVVQTSESSVSNPLGRTGSRAVSAGNGYIGKYHSDDYGYIMSVLTIVPDVYHTKGIDKMWSRLQQDQYHFPIMDNLSPEPILNKELFVSGTENVDNDVFAYQERTYEYKSRRNRVAGSMRLDSDQSPADSAYTMKRVFKSTPQLNYGFTGMFPSNIDYSVFSNSIDAPFIFSIRSNVRASLPLPYVTMPADGLTNTI